MSKLLVAGGTGLIGSELVRQATSSGHEVTLLSRNPGTINGRAIAADLLEPRNLEATLRGERFDAIVYLAQAADHNSFPQNASNAVAVNIAAPVALCQWAIESGCSRFVLGSSGGICRPAEGNARINESSERQAAEKLNFYLSTKARCEELLLAFNGQLTIDVLRYFFVYGRSQRPNFLLPRLISKMRSEQSIEVAQGHGPLLNPIHARDAARLTLRTLDLSGGGVTNVAGLEDVTLRDLVVQLEQATGKTAQFVSTDDRAPRYLADTNLMVARLGVPQVSLAEGIKMSFGEE